MRVAIGILALLGLGIWALWTPDSPWHPTLAPSVHVTPAKAGAQFATAPNLVASASKGATAAKAGAQIASPTPEQASAQLAANIPASLPAPAALPQTLELVSLPTLSSGAKAAPTSISRADAVASVMTSREFQETVSPLARLYLATFGRYPDYEGLNYYTGQREEARPLHEIANEFVRSREFELRYGELGHAQFVEMLFNNVLGNAHQADVRAYWVEALDSGRMTRGEVLVDLAESGAFRERSAHQVFVSTAYTEILRRTPDPTGYAYWVAQLRAGQPPDSVINGLLRGP